MSEPSRPRPRPSLKCNGLLLAAGRGRRMGGSKQFHLAQTVNGQKPLVAAAFDTISRVCDKMFVVLGHRAEEVAAALKKGSELFSSDENSSEPFLPFQFQEVESDPDAPMFNSIKTGLRAVIDSSRTFTRSGDDVYILLQLGDHPSLQTSTLEDIFAIAADQPNKAVLPTFQGQGGHPVLIPSTVAEKILDTPCPDGLCQFWLEHPELCLRVEVDDPGVTRDIDTI